MSTFVSLGNMKKPFNRLIDKVLCFSDILPKPIVIQHGHTNIDSYKYRDLKFYKFLCYDEYKLYIKNSDICIGHCGAGFVLDCISSNKKPLVLARKAVFGEHVDDHQRELLEYLLRANKAYDMQTCDVNFECLWTFRTDDDASMSKTYIHTISKSLSNLLEK